MHVPLPSFCMFHKLFSSAGGVLTPSILTNNFFAAFRHNLILILIVNLRQFLHGYLPLTLSRSDITCATQTNTRLPRLTDEITLSTFKFQENYGSIFVSYQHLCIKHLSFVARKQLLKLMCKTDRQRSGMYVSTDGYAYLLLSTLKQWW